MLAVSLRPLTGAMLSLLLVLSLPACDTTNPQQGETSVVIHVVNTDGVDLAGMTVTVDGQPVGGVASSYPVNLTAGSHTVEVTTGTFGYLPYAGTLTVAADAPTTVDHFITVRGPADVRGSVVNAQTGAGVDGATVQFIRQFGGQGGPASLGVEYTRTTDANGGFTIDDAPTGFFTVVVNRAGFVETRIPDVELASGVIELSPVAATTAPPVGSFRIVLSWGPTPPDLDSHLTGPDGAGGRFHVYYANRTFGGTSLDLDDTDGQGPETITVDTSVDGTYRYSVYNYSDQSAAGGLGIAGDQTRIQVFGATGLVKTYLPAFFPAVQPTATSGNALRVFEMEVSGGTIAFRDNNGSTLGYVQVTGPGDFLAGGSPAPAKLTL